MTTITHSDSQSAYKMVSDFPSNCATITKSDTNTHEPPVIVYVGVGGDVAIVPPMSTTAVTFKNVPSGGVVPCKASKIMSTNTTATDMVAVM